MLIRVRNTQHRNSVREIEQGHTRVDLRQYNYVVVEKGRQHIILLIRKGLEVPAQFTIEYEVRKKINPRDMYSMDPMKQLNYFNGRGKGRETARVRVTEREIKERMAIWEVY